MLLAGIMLTGCGDEGSGDEGGGDERGGEPTSSNAESESSGGTSSPESSGGTGSDELAISGSAPRQVMTGDDFTFEPSADAGGAFSVSNLPSWASFDPETGRITGTLEDADVGRYTNIRISISNGSESASLTFTIEVVATATGSATLTWQPPTEYTDGTPLSDLAGYKIYWGKSEDKLNHSLTLAQPGLTSYVIDELTSGTWYFATKAYNDAGVESAFSNIASKTIQ